MQGHSLKSKRKRGPRKILTKGQRLDIKEIQEKEGDRDWY